MTQLHPYYKYDKLVERVGAFHADVMDRNLCIADDTSDLFFLYELLMHERAQHKKELAQAWYDGEDVGWWSCEHQDHLAEGVVIGRYNPYDPIFDLLGKDDSE